MSVAKKTRTCGFRENRREIIVFLRSSGTSCDFFGQLIPTLAIPYLRAHLPAKRLGFLLYALLQHPDAVGDAPFLVFLQVVAPHVATESLEIRGEGAPQTPVGRAELRDVFDVHRVPVSVLYGAIVQQSQRVPDVFLVELDDLELGQEQFGQRDRQGLNVESLAKAYLVGHPEGAHQDVHLTIVLAVKVQQSLLTVHRVEANVGLVAQSLEKALHLGRCAPRCDPIQVGVLALERGVEAILGPQLDRHPTEQPERKTLPVGLPRDAQGLFDDVGPEITHAVTTGTGSRCRFYGSQIPVSARCHPRRTTPRLARPTTCW